MVVCSSNIGQRGRPQLAPRSMSSALDRPSSACEPADRRRPGPRSRRRSRVGSASSELGADGDGDGGRRRGRRRAAGVADGRSRDAAGGDEPADAGATRAAGRGGGGDAQRRQSPTSARSRRSGARIGAVGHRAGRRAAVAASLASGARGQDVAFLNRLRVSAMNRRRVPSCLGTNPRGSILPPSDRRCRLGRRLRSSFSRTGQAARPGDATAGRGDERR